MSRSRPHLVTPLDLALVRRVVAHPLPLDLSAALTRGLNGLEDAFLSSVPLTDLGAPTIVLRNGDGGYVGQFRHRLGESVAQLVLVAPEPQEGDMPEWTRLLEAIAFEAGKRGAHLLNAEVAENHPAFIAFRMAGFAVYSRQVILCRRPRPVSGGIAGMLRPKVDQDMFAINTLYANTVPPLLQQAELLPGPECGGLVYERSGDLAGYLAITEGKSGVVIKPYFHPEVYDLASDIVLSALRYIPRAEQVPVYLYARAYQDWLRGALEQVEFEPWAHQALMVKYTTVRVARVQHDPLPNLEPSRLRPPVADGPLPFRKLFNRDDRQPSWRRHGK